MKTKKYKSLRAVRVYYSGGNIMETNMASGLSDKEIHAYYKKDRVFNIGSVGDKLVRVRKIKILK